MIIEIIFAILLFSAIMTLGYAFNQIKSVANNAFAFIKADNIEEKVQSDSLDRTLKKIEKIAPPEVKKPPDNHTDLNFARELIRSGPKNDEKGHTWEIV